MIEPHTHSPPPPPGHQPTPTLTVTAPATPLLCAIKPDPRRAERILRGAAKRTQATYESRLRGGPPPPPPTPQLFGDELVAEMVEGLHRLAAQAAANPPAENGAHESTALATRIQLWTRSSVPAEFHGPHDARSDFRAIIESPAAWLPAGYVATARLLMAADKALVVFTGGSGCGKSALGAAAVREACRAGQPAQFWGWGMLRDELGSLSYSACAARTSSLVRLRLLVLDNLENLSGEHERRLLTRIVQDRMDAKRRTILLAALDTPADVAALVPALAARIESAERTLAISASWPNIEQTYRAWRDRQAAQAKNRSTKAG